NISQHERRHRRAAVGIEAQRIDGGHLVGEVEERLERVGEQVIHLLRSKIAAELNGMGSLDPRDRGALAPTVERAYRQAGGSGSTDAGKSGNAEGRKALDLGLIGQRFGEPERGDVESEGPGNRVYDEPGEAAVELAD